MGIVDHCLEDNYKMAQKLFNQHSLFIQNLFIESNPVPIKYVLYRNQLINNPDVRLPLYQLDRENKLLLDNYIFNDTVSN